MVPGAYSERVVPGASSAVETAGAPLHNSSLRDFVHGGVHGGGGLRDFVHRGTDWITSARAYFLRLFSFAFLVKALCIVSSMCTQISPLPEVRKIVAEGDTGAKDSLA